MHSQVHTGKADNQKEQDAYELYIPLFEIDGKCPEKRCRRLSVSAGEGVSRGFFYCRFYRTEVWIKDPGAVNAESDLQCLNAQSRKEEGKACLVGELFIDTPVKNTYNGDGKQFVSEPCYSRHKGGQYGITDRFKQYQKAHFLFSFGLNFGEGSCASITAVKIIAHPISSRLVGICERSIEPNSKANTDSRLISREATVGFVCF